MAVSNLQVVYRKLNDLAPYERNTRTHSEGQIVAIANSIREMGFTNPVLLKDDDRTIGAGHARVMAAVQAGLEEVPTITLHGLTEDQWRMYVIADNRLAEVGSGWDEKLLQEEFRHLTSVDADLLITGFSSEDIDALLNPKEPEPEVLRVSLQDRFGAVPFSVLSAREGWWQGRKKAWLALGIKSELGRGENALGFSETILNSGKPAKGKGKARTFGQDLMKGEHTVGQTASLKGGLALGTSTDPYRKPGEEMPASGAGTSIFDPVLCELAYRWFCPPGGDILDPFAGGSVRGVVASKLGRAYLGCELREEQVVANRGQAEAICSGDFHPPQWLVGDSRELLRNKTTPGQFDFIFSCPPYADLEVYSDNPQDLSTMAYDEFIKVYREIIAAAVAKLKRDRFAAFIVGDVRDPKGIYRNFVSETISAFVDAGAPLYNEAILVTAAGSLPIRAGKQFASTRKLGKALANGTPILTPTGWTAIDDLRPGDQVYAVDGTPTRVTGVFPQGPRQMHNVSFHDGCWIEADAEHLWAIDQRGQTRQVMTTAQIVDRCGQAPSDPRPMIPTAEPVQLPGRPVPADPYLIGQLLGDGGLTGNTPILSTADAETADLLPSLLPPGMQIKARGYDLRLVGTGSRSLKNPLTIILRSLSMMGVGSLNKSVPEVYLWNEVAVRLAVLRGLMDSDGTVSGGSSGTTEFQSGSERLADDVAFLARSLGIRASIHKRGTASGNLAWRVRLRGGPCPFLLSRKAEPWMAADAKRVKSPARRISSILPGRVALATCIAVEHPSSLFLARDFIVTHNTHQNILVFVKGDPAKATVACGEVEFGQVPEAEDGKAAEVTKDQPGPDAPDSEFGEQL